MSAADRRYQTHVEKYRTIYIYYTHCYGFSRAEKNPGTNPQQFTLIFLTNTVVCPPTQFALLLDVVQLFQSYADLQKS